MNCNVIKDLMPLYAEDMLSRESRELVDEHVRTCAACRSELDAIKKAPRMPLDVDTGGLKRVGRAIRRKRLLAALTAAMTLIAALVTGWTFMNTPIYISAEDAIDGAEQRENGALAIDFGDSVTGYGAYTTADGNNMFLWCTSSRQGIRARNQCLKDMENNAADDSETSEYPYDVGTKLIKQSPQERADFLSNTQVMYPTWKAADGEFYPGMYESAQQDCSDGEWIGKPAEKNVWYLNASDPQASTLIWQGAQAGDVNAFAMTSRVCVSLFIGAQTGDVNAFAMTSRVYVLLFIGALVLAAVLLLIARRRRGAVWTVFRCISVACICLAASILLVTNGAMLMGDTEWPRMIAAETLALTAAALVWVKQIRLIRA